MKKLVDAKVVEIENNVFVSFSGSESPPSCNFIGREPEMRLCRAAFGISSEDWTVNDKLKPLHFRLEGPPGVGKNEIVYEIARNLAESENLPFYSMQGHEEMTPEDMSILVVPDPEGQGGTPLQLRASPLAEALYEGGMFFFDEINRVPERALSPLSSVLDKRKYIYSAMTGMRIEPRDEDAKQRFRFCCALNPNYGEAGQGSLPDYLDERTLPLIKIDYHDSETLKKILASSVTNDPDFIGGFSDWYNESSRRELSIRQALILAEYALNMMTESDAPVDAIRRAEMHVLTQSRGITADSREAAKKKTAKKTRGKKTKKKSD